MTRGQIALLVALGITVLAVYVLLGLLVTGRIPIGLPPAPTDMPAPIPTSTPEPGLSRQNPMPFGETIATDSMEIRLLEVHRHADSLISPLNSPIPQGHEVVVVKVEVSNHGSEPLTLSPGTFRMTGDRAILYQRPPLLLDGELRGDLTPGETRAGYLAFIVADGEDNLALAFVPSGSVSEERTRWLWADPDPAPNAFAIQAVAPTASPRTGGSRLNPALMRQPAVADDQLEISVLSVQRDAWPIIREMSPLNQPPEPDKEYVLVRLRVRFLGHMDQLLSVNWWGFRMTGADNILYPNPSLILENELKGDLFSTGTLEGNLAFQVRRGEENLILVYDPSGVGAKIGRGVRWFWASETPNLDMLKMPVRASAALPASGRSYQQPAPTGVPVLTDGQWEITVEDAAFLPDDASTWDRWTLPLPEPGRRYVLITVTMRNLAPEERPQTIQWQGFLLHEPVGASVYKPTVLGGTELEGDAFTGATLQAYLVFQVGSGQRFILSYDPAGLGNTASYRWFLIEP